MKTGSFGGEGARGDHGAAELGPLGQLQRNLLPRLQGQWDALLAELLHYATSVRVHFAEPREGHPAPRHRQTLQGSFSAVSKPNFASKYSLESSRRDLHDALLCTALKSHFFKNLLEFFQILRKFSDFLLILQIFAKFQKFVKNCKNLANF